MLTPIFLFILHIIGSIAAYYVFCRFALSITNLSWDNTDRFFCGAICFVFSWIAFIITCLALGFKFALDYGKDKKVANPVIRFLRKLEPDCLEER